MNKYELEAFLKIFLKRLAFFENYLDDLRLKVHREDDELIINAQRLITMTKEQIYLQLEKPEILAQDTQETSKKYAAIERSFKELYLKFVDSFNTGAPHA